MTTPSVPDRPEPDTSNPPDAEPALISAVIPGRLAAPAPPGTVARLREESWWKRAREVASDWQAVSPLADFWELALVPPVQPGRGRELGGLIAAAGEQLALGWLLWWRLNCGVCTGGTRRLPRSIWTR